MKEETLEIIGRSYRTYEEIWLLVSDPFGDYIAKGFVEYLDGDMLKVNGEWIRLEYVVSATTPLSPRAARMAKELDAYIKNNGHPPSVAKLGKLSGYKSRGHLAERISQLESAGIIACDPLRISRPELLDSLQ